MNVRKGLFSEKRFLNPRRGSNPQPSWWPVRRSKLAIRVLVAEWLERLASHQKVAGSIPVWDSEIGFSENRAWRTFIYHFSIFIILTSWAVKSSLPADGQKPRTDICCFFFNYLRIGANVWLWKIHQRFVKRREFLLFNGAFSLNLEGLK